MKYFQEAERSNERSEKKPEKNAKSEVMRDAKKHNYDTSGGFADMPDSLFKSRES